MSDFDDLIEHIKTIRELGHREEFTPEIRNVDYNAENKYEEEFIGNLGMLDEYANLFEESQETGLEFRDKKIIYKDSEGGYEGAGEHMSYVLEYDGRYLEISGTYSSWDDSTWDYGSISEVVPREVTVTRWVSAR